MDGNKTYAVAIGFVVMAVGGYLSGEMTWQVALASVLTGAGLAAIRHAIEKVLASHVKALAAVESALDMAARVAPKAK